jgi:hypothetical protein
MLHRHSSRLLQQSHRSCAEETHDQALSTNLLVDIFCCVLCILPYMDTYACMLLPEATCNEERLESIVSSFARACEYGFSWENSTGPSCPLQIAYSPWRRGEAISPTALGLGPSSRSSTCDVDASGMKMNEEEWPFYSLISGTCVKSTACLICQAALPV